MGVDAVSHRSRRAAAVAASTVLAIVSSGMGGSTAWAQAAPATTNEPPVTTTEPPAPTNEPPATSTAPAGTQPPTPIALSESPQQAMMTTHGWTSTFYGFVELDGIRDSSQSFGDSVGNTPLLRTDGSSPSYLPVGVNPPGVTYASKNPRFMVTPRNTTFGFRVVAPEVGHANVKFTSVIELDFFGNQPGNPISYSGSPTTETAFFSSATPRMRHAYVEAKNPIVDVLVGQAYNLFGWQPLFFPPTDSFLGTPNMVFDRRPQLRLTRAIDAGPVTIQIAAAALRPAQSSSDYPDLVGGLLVQVNGWRGAHMLGPSQPRHDPLSIGISGVHRYFQVAEFQDNTGAPGTAQQTAKAYGNGVSIDALLPIIPVRDPGDRSNGLTLTGSFVTGSGIGDLYTGGLTGGATFPNPLGPQGSFTGTYTSNIDPGVVQYGIQTDGMGNQVLTPQMNWIGILRTIDWQTYMIGAQYYLPFLRGRFVVTGNYTHASSGNIQQQGTNNFAYEVAAGGNPTRTFKAASYYDANVFMGLTDYFKVALSWQHVEQVFLAHGPPGMEVMGDATEHNDRVEVSTFFFF
jgi:hypothetical protein